MTICVARKLAEDIIVKKRLCRSKEKCQMNEKLFIKKNGVCKDAVFFAKRKNVNAHIYWRLNSLSSSFLGARYFAITESPTMASPSAISNAAQLRWVMPVGFNIEVGVIDVSQPKNIALRSGLLKLVVIFTIIIFAIHSWHLEFI